MHIDAILTGPVARFGPRGEASAIVKTAVESAVSVGLLGLKGDAQADLSVHGGPDKAIHHYPREHYGWWAERIAHPSLAAPGAFGENISTHGLTEEDVCIGDRFRLGSALVEVAQGRQPCWKQAHRLGDTSVVGLMVKTGRSGWYYRVIEPGRVAAGEALNLVERQHPGWSVARTTALIVAGVGRDADSVRALRAVTALAQAWVKRL